MRILSVTENLGFRYSIAEQFQLEEYDIYRRPRYTIIGRIPEYVLSLLVEGQLFTPGCHPGRIRV